MKREYIVPQVSMTELHTESILAVSTDRIPIGESEIKPSATSKYEGAWDSQQWSDPVWGEE